jgi:hypothetical protein
VEHWSLLLAGPVVRRVQPDLVSAWVALKEARRVRLSVWQGNVNVGSGDGLATGPAPLFSGSRDTVRVGERFHVAVVTAVPSGALAAGQTLAYNVAFGPPGVDGPSTEDLRSLGLLRDQAAQGTGDTARLGQVALGYEPGQLPTFVLPPPELADLRLAHASCRRPHADARDLLPALDELIRSGRGDIRRRPQQLLLTGDQIYADDVATGLLHVLTPIANELMGAVEQLPTRWSLAPSQSGVRLEPAERSRFPAGVRKPVVMDDARLTTADGQSHLLSLGEFCAMHLLAWSNTLWPAALPSYADVFWGETLPALEFDEVLAGLSLPPDIWRLHTGLEFDTRHGLRHRYPKAEATQFQARHVGRLLSAVAQDDVAAQAYQRQTDIVRKFRDGLPQVRRALANIATYMIFDDHEVTDDWNLNRLWRDRVFSSPLGSTVLRNGLVAYAVCQGWGNDPQAFERDGSTTRSLLDAVPRLFPPSEDLPPHTATADGVDLLLGLDGRDPPVRWHFSVTGPRHRVLFLDVRNRRAYRDRVAAPSNLSTAAIADQIPPGPLPTGLELLVVVSPLPLFGLPVSDEVGGSVAYRTFDVMKHSDIAGMPGTNPDAAEAWVQDPATLEAVLKRLAPYRRVVVLSGDVHYAHSGEGSYWTKTEAVPSRFAQFTSSGAKNVWPHAVLTLSRSFAFAQAIERLANPVELLGWDQPTPMPLSIPSGVDLLPPARARLRRTPLLLPTHGWPEGTTIERTPDWSWRFRLSRDQRPVSEVPEAARPEPPDPAAPSADVTTDIDGYRKVARRHARMLTKVPHTRQVLFDSNIGVVSFDRSAGRLTARHELHAHPEGVVAPAVFSLHTVVLEAASGDPTELSPVIGRVP